MRIMITGGGTGGHISPAVAVVQELQARDKQLVLQWVGKKGSLEERVCASLSLSFRSVPVQSWPRKFRVLGVFVLIKLFFGVLYGMIHISNFRPQVVLATGGYVSVPLGVAAWLMKVPLIIHEQNKRLGMANKLLAPKAKMLILSYPDTKGDYSLEKSCVLGNPVRTDFLSLPARSQARASLELDESVPVVFVYGGSQGARSLNRALGEAIARFAEDEVQFLWMTGRHDVGEARQKAESVAARVEVFSFVDDMAGTCAAADLIICRAGASSTAEIAAMGKPSILVPYPHAAENHQEQNARAFEEAGAAVVVLDSECTADRLAELISSMLSDTDKLGEMGTAAGKLAYLGAATLIVDQILALAFKNEDNDSSEKKDD